MKRRDVLKMAVVMPLVGDVIRPWHLDIVDYDGQLWYRDYEHAEWRAHICLYGRTAIAPDEIKQCRDDESLRQLIKNRTDQLADEFYNLVKSVASDPTHEAWQHAEPLVKSDFLSRQKGFAREGEKLVWR